jgi:hypothetical protein
MASQQQIDANRLNAKKSTGATTPEGKAVTRLNAKRDGFTGQITTLSDEDRPIFENFKSRFITDLAPKTTMELSLATSIAWDTWRLNHLRAVEMNMYALGHDPDNAQANVIDCDEVRIHTALTDAMTFANESNKFALMSIYEQRMNRSIHKNLATLRDLQAERKRNYKQDRAQEVILARYSDIKGLTYQAPASPTLNGSVFSNDEVFAAASRVSTLEVAKNVVKRESRKVLYAAATAGTPSDIHNWPQPDAA